MLPWPDPIRSRSAFGRSNRWKACRNGEGLEVSLAEPIRDPSVQDAVRLLIEGKETMQQVTFL